MTSTTTTGWAPRTTAGNTASTTQVGQHFDVWTENGVDVMGEKAALPATRTGTWTVASCACFNHGKTRYSTAKGATLTYKGHHDNPGQVLTSGPTNRSPPDLPED